MGHMKPLILNCFSHLFSFEIHQTDQGLLGKINPEVTQDMNDMVNAPYSQKEVKTALFQMFPTKAPGPDGFLAHFFQHHQDICGDDVTKEVLKIMEGSESAESINETLFVLIPKVKNPTLLT